MYVHHQYRYIWNISSRLSSNCEALASVLKTFILFICLMILRMNLRKCLLGIIYMVVLYATLNIWVLYMELFIVKGLIHFPYVLLFDVLFVFWFLICFRYFIILEQTSAVIIRNMSKWIHNHVNVPRFSISSSSEQTQHQQLSIDHGKTNVPRFVLVSPIWSQMEVTCGGFSVYFNHLFHHLNLTSFIVWSGNSFCV